MPVKQRRLDQQAANEAARSAKAAADAERIEAASWADGAKSNAKQRAMEEKEMERARRQAEVSALQAAEESDLGTITVKKKTKKKGKDDFDLLNAALAAAPKTKAQKEKEAKQKELAERKKKMAAEQVEGEARREAQDAVTKKAALKGIVMNHADELMLHKPAEVNRLEEDEIAASGLGAAVDAMSLGVVRTPGGSKIGSNNRTALYNAFYERMLPQFREDHPGLKLSQYKERIADKWRTSPENPDYQRRIA
jgi:hypothetical protein